MAQKLLVPTGARKSYAHRGIRKATQIRVKQKQLDAMQWFNIY